MVWEVSLHPFHFDWLLKYLHFLLLMYLTLAWIFNLILLFNLSFDRPTNYLLNYFLLPLSNFLNLSRCFHFSHSSHALNRFLHLFVRTNHLLDFDLCKEFQQFYKLVIYFMMWKCTNIHGFKKSKNSKFMI